MPAIQWKTCSKKSLPMNLSEFLCIFSHIGGARTLKVRTSLAMLCAISPVPGALSLIQGLKLALFWAGLLCGLVRAKSFSLRAGMETEDGCNLGTIFLNPADFSNPQSWLERKGVFTFREQRQNCKVQHCLFLRNFSLVKEQHFWLLEVP